MLLFPIGTQNAFGSLIGDEVTVEFIAPDIPQTGIVVNDLVNPEFTFFLSGGLRIFINVESEEFWIEWTNPSPTATVTSNNNDFTISDLDWIENGVVVPGVIQDVTCTQEAQIPIILGIITFTNSEIHIPLVKVSRAPLDTVKLHCVIDVIHEGDKVVGGEFSPIDSTALLLAGLQTSAIWMLPVLAGVAGSAFGVLYIKSRRN